MVMAAEHASVAARAPGGKEVADLERPVDPVGPVESTRCLVIGHSWRGGTPTLHMWAPPINRLEVAPLAGELCLTPLPERQCVGRRDPEQGGRVPCPYAATLG